MGYRLPESVGYAQGQTAAAAAASAALANPTDDRLRTLRDADRRLVLARLLAASGERCGELIEAFRQGTDRAGVAYWSVRCATGAALQVRIAPDAGGSTRIVPCHALPPTAPCFVKF